MGSVRRWGAAVCLVGVAWAAGAPAASAAAQEPAVPVARVPILDTHAHPARSRRDNVGRSASLALGRLDRYGIGFAILLPPPFPSEPRDRYGSGDLAAVAKDHPDRFAFAAGGESINVLLMSTPADAVTPAVAQRLAQAAEAVARAGAVAIGEIAIEHLSSGRDRHPYESVPADHPLLLALADAAARLDLPVDVHMEAVPEEMAPPRARGAANPSLLRANIAAFERLLDHDPRARFIWAHAGWDNTFERTVDLMRSLLARHPNLYMSIKVQPRGPQRNSPFAADGTIRPGWLELLRDFPNRFVVGTDQFYDDEDDDRLAAARRLVDALPPALAKAVAYENAYRLYCLGSPPLPR